MGALGLKFITRSLSQSKANKMGEKKRNPQLSNPKSWPNLPQHLINSIAKQPNLMQNITSFGCVTKTWRSPSTKCSCRRPRLVEINGKQRASARSHAIEIPFSEERPYPYSSYRRRPTNKFYSHPGLYFKGHSHGRIVAVGANMSDLYFVDPVARSHSTLPPWNPNLSFKACTLSSTYGDACTVMVLTGESSPAFAFYRCGRRGMINSCEWIVRDCNIKERYDDGKNMQLINAIGFEGKFYALSLQGSVVVIEDVNSCFRITAVGGSRAVPCMDSRRFREYMVECDGEIMLVFLVSRKGIDVVDDVEVFRLDFGELLWVKIGGIGDRALFVEDECCMGVDAGKLGCRKNCVYFNYHRLENWWVFDMETQEIYLFG